MTLDEVSHIAHVDYLQSQLRAESRKRRDAEDRLEVESEVALEAEARATFLALFYKERLGRMVQELEAIGKVSVDGVRAALFDIVTRADAEGLCNDVCDGMYFCELPAGHPVDSEHPHQEGGLRW